MKDLFHIVKNKVVKILGRSIEITKTVFSGIITVAININEIYKEKSKSNKELPSIVIIGGLTIFVLSTVLLINGISEPAKIETVTTSLSEVKIAKNLGEEDFYNGNYDSAFAEYEKLQKDEEWPIYEIKMAEICSVRGDYDRANTLIDEAYEKRNKLIESTEGEKYKERDGELGNYITLISLFDGLSKNALEYGEIFLEANPHNKDLQKTMFTTYLLTENESKAEEIVKNYNLNEGDSYDLALYARMNMLINKWDEGFHYLKKAWYLDKDEVKVFDIISQVASYDKEGVIDRLINLSEKEPNEVAYKVWLTKCYSMSSKSMDEAENTFNEIKNQDLGKSLFNTVIAKIYQYKGEDAKAEALIQDIMKEETLIGYQTAAWYYYDKGNYDKAIEYCKRGIIENQQYPDNYGFLMADIMIKKGQPELAEPYFRTALVKEPFNYNIILKVAEYYDYTMKNPEKAYEYFTFASLIKPNNSEIYYSMALAKLDSGKGEEALELVNKAITIEEESVKYHRTLGTIYLEEGNPDKAIEEIRKAYELDNNDILSLNNAACYYVSVENNITRGYENILAAYEKMPETIDEETKRYITRNYEKIKELNEKHNNDNNGKLQIPDLHLFY